jgi:TPR repeat protein
LLLLRADILITVGCASAVLLTALVWGLIWSHARQKDRECYAAISAEARACGNPHARIEAYCKYLSAFPEGRYRSQAEAAVQQSTTQIPEWEWDQIPKAERAYREGEGFYSRGCPAGAAKPLLVAAEAGHAGAQERLAGMYADGLGVEKNMAEAIRLYTKLGQADNTNAQLRLAGIYRRGDGVAPDRSTAVEWYRKAAELGNAEALGALGVYSLWGGSFEEGDDPLALLGAWKWIPCLNITVKVDEALSYLRKAADLDDPLALFYVGALQYWGIGMQADRESARQLFARATSRDPKAERAAEMITVGWKHEREMLLVIAGLRSENLLTSSQERTAQEMGLAWPVPTPKLTLEEAQHLATARAEQQVREKTPALSDGQVEEILRNASLAYPLYRQGTVPYSDLIELICKSEESIFPKAGYLKKDGAWLSPQQAFDQRLQEERRRVLEGAQMEVLTGQGYRLLEYEWLPVQIHAEQSWRRQIQRAEEARASEAARLEADASWRASVAEREVYEKSGQLEAARSRLRDNLRSQGLDPRLADPENSEAWDRMIQQRARDAGLAP